MLRLTHSGWGSGPALLQHITFRTSEILLVLPTDHPLAYFAAPEGQSYNTIDINLLKEDKFILKNNDTKARKIVDNYLEKNNFIPNIIMECTLGQLVYNMVKNGVGPAFLYEDEVVPGDSLPKFSLNPREYWNYSIAFREDTQFTQAENFFISLITDGVDKSISS